MWPHRGVNTVRGWYAGGFGGYFDQSTRLLFMWEAHLGSGLLFGAFPRLRVICLGVLGREWALALDAWLFPCTRMAVLLCVSVSACPYLR